MDCVICQAPLTTREHEGVQLDSCPHGCGVWVGLSELASIAQAEETPRPQAERDMELAQSGRGMANVVAAATNEGERLCPVCGDGMKKLEYANSGIVMDRCGGHGAWLDAGELERVEAFAEGFRASMARFA